MAIKKGGNGLESRKSLAAWQTAQQLIPGGVNSPVRNFSKVGGHPRFIARGEGSKIYDIDGNEYIDYVASWGPLVLGHAHPKRCRGYQCSRSTRHQLRRTDNTRNRTRRNYRQRCAFD